MNSEDFKELRTKFTLVCNKCGKSDQVVIGVVEGRNYGGQTGYSEGTVSVGCNSCNNNDFFCNQ